MTEHHQDLMPASSEAIARFVVVSCVLAGERGGQARVEAVATVAEQIHIGPNNSSRRSSRRTVYRWLAAYESRGFAGLEPAKHIRTHTSVTLPKAFVDFMKSEKQVDPKASIPELIRRARERGIIDQAAEIDRVTAWRCCKRMGVSTVRRKKAGRRDTRRFAYPHRLDMVLCDGKHFRAGPKRLRRVALFFLDDSTRMGLHVVVGTSESAELFLRGLYGMVKRHGHFSIIYMDNGPGFIADDTVEVVKKLNSLLIHGEAAYPEGHGKVERFNKTALAQLLRALDKRPDVDADCGALELRLSHYLREVYNHIPHEGIGKKTPHERFHADTKPLHFHNDDHDLRRRFVVHFERLVSADHVVSIDSVLYEVPRGHAGEKITIHRRLLDNSMAVLHDGCLVDLQQLDPVANAHARRARLDTDDEGETEHPIYTAADTAYARALSPVVGSDGGYSDKENTP